jgi:hypothetical protein
MAPRAEPGFDDGEIDNMTGFKVPHGLIGRFGVIKLWPDIQVAEDEVIARIINTANLLGLECLVLDHMGRDIKSGGRQMTDKDLDFVIHLHFSTPKSYDIFSFVTIWNPTSFFHDFGYRATAENILTHDDYLSCQSPGADLHLERLILDDASHLPSAFTLFHSLATPILPPSLGNFQIFYMGINWEKLGQPQSRHQAVLNLLDKTSLLRIYGPDLLRGVKVWDGFASYQRSLPFDGVSVIKEIHEAGVCLALSSEPHKDAALMSNRLFEGLAAGALIICDENPFAKKHFGDTLLYVDTRDGADAVAARIIEHMEWARREPEKALELATQSQNIFKKNFSMDASLADLYSGFQARKEQLAALYTPTTSRSKVRVTFLAPDPADTNFDKQVQAAREHIRLGFQSILLVDAMEIEAANLAIACLPAEERSSVTIRTAEFYQRDSAGSIVKRNRIGGILKQEFEASPRDSLLCFVTPNETLFSNHVTMLAGVLEKNPDADYAYSKAILEHTDDKDEISFAVEQELDLLSKDPASQIGLGRFLFRANAFEKPVTYLLPSLDIRTATGLAVYKTGCSTQRASLTIAADRRFPLGLCAGKNIERNAGLELWHEIEAIRDLNPPRFDILGNYKKLQDHIHHIENRSRESNDLLHREFGNLHAALTHLDNAFKAVQKNFQHDIGQVDSRTRESNDILHREFGNLHRAFMNLSSDGIANTGPVSAGGMLRIAPIELSIDNLSRGDRRKLLFQLLGSLPVPGLVRRAIRKLRSVIRSIRRR